MSEAEIAVLAAQLAERWAEHEEWRRAVMFGPEPSFLVKCIQWGVLVLAVVLLGLGTAGNKED